MAYKMTDKENPNFIERFTVRMPDGLRDDIAERAKNNSRSMNSEIVKILGDTIYGLNQDGDDFEQMLKYVTTETPADEDEWRVRDKMLTQLVFQITSRLERENTRLKKLFAIRAPDGIYNTHPVTHNKFT